MLKNIYIRKTAIDSNFKEIILKSLEEPVNYDNPRLKGQLELIIQMLEKDIAVDEEHEDMGIDNGDLTVA